MGGTLRVDADALVQLGYDLRQVAQEFDQAQTNADDIATCAGHTGLEGKIRHFANGWDDRRVRMIDSIAGLAEAAHGCGDAFSKADTELAAALEGAKQPAQLTTER